MKVHLFDSVAREYTMRVSPYRYSQFLALLHELKLGGNEKVLDIGCGPGVLSLEAAARVKDGHLVGIDLSTNMVELARELAGKLNSHNTEFSLGDALSLEFDDNSFDAVFSSNAFPWVADQKQFLREARRVLKPDGRLGLVSLSDIVYREFIAALKHVLRRNPNLFLKKTDPYSLMKARTYDLERLGREVADSGFNVYRIFQMTTEEPISPKDYLKRVNAIVDENYLDGLGKSERRKARNEISLALARQNGDLHITESSVFVIARKI